MRRLRLALWPAAALIGVVAPCMALAASAGGEPVQGMPQLAFGHPEQGRLLISQIVWLVIIFGLLYYVMARYALPQVGRVLEARRGRIAADLDAAQAAKLQADAALADHRAATAKARAEAQAAIAAASQAAQAEAAARSEALNARLAAQIDEAEVRIGRARDQAMGALRQVATETTDALLDRLIGRVDSAAIEGAVDRELAARGQS